MVDRILRYLLLLTVSVLLLLLPQPSSTSPPSPRSYSHRKSPEHPPPLHLQIPDANRGDDGSDARREGERQDSTLRTIIDGQAFELEQGTQHRPNHKEFITQTPSVALQTYTDYISSRTSYRYPALLDAGSTLPAVSAWLQVKGIPRGAEAWIGAVAQNDSAARNGETFCVALVVPDGWREVDDRQECNVTMRMSLYQILL
ncbi:hypothetical protein HDU96_007662 [Phlyctochytrium bullatum]|nr:hypothetical protein HDU96_007662 [Phlyctochytrium bullatum]